MATRPTTAELNEVLVESIREGDPAGVRRAIAAGAELDARVRPSQLIGTKLDRNLTPFMWACTGTSIANAGLEMAELMLELGADIDGVDEGGVTALHVALIQRSLWNWKTLVAFLLARGADVNTCTRGYGTPLETACRNKNPDIVRSLLEKGAMITDRARVQAALWPEVVEVLETWPIVSATLSDHDRSLFFAARRGDIEEVRTLLSGTANPDVRDANGASPVAHALTRGHFELARFLSIESVRRQRLGEADAGLLVAAAQDDPVGTAAALASGANVSVRNAAGKTALMLAGIFDGARAIACLLDGGAGVDEANEGATALVHACDSGALAAVRALLEGGAAVDLRWKKRSLPLRYAVSRQHPEILALLLRSGASPSSESEYQDLVQAAKDAEVRRLLEEARLGRLPPDPAGAHASLATCPLCSGIPNRVSWSRSANDDYQLRGEPIPDEASRFEIFPGYPELRKCPLCLTYYRYEKDHDGGMMDGFDSEDLERISLDRAIGMLEERIESQGAPSPRWTRELAAAKARRAANMPEGADVTSVELNTASFEALQRIPGIGPSRALRILERRLSVPFRSVAELEEIPGVGPRMLDGLKRHCHVAS